MARHVLIVDDDLDIRETLAELLTDEGFEVATAANGREALDAMRESLPVVVLLDLMMPVMSGFQFLAERAGDPRLTAVPVIVITAGRLAAPPPGSQGMVSKPLDLQLLFSTLRTYCPAQASSKK
jgi:CheY-like chemotaxis protein